MHFSTWLWEQMDVPSNISEIAKLCWADVNNGCASVRFSGQDWVRHFDEKHKEKKDRLINMLMLAYLEYLEEMGK